MTTKFCTLVFLRKGDQILLAMKKRGFGAGLWNGAGGKIEAHETKEAAMLRECKEEIGVLPKEYELVAVNDFINDAVTEPWRMYVYVYLCTKWQGEPSESEEMSPQWFALDQIPYKQMWDDDIFWLPQIINGQKIKGLYKFDQHNKLLDHYVTVKSKL